MPESLPLVIPDFDSLKNSFRNYLRQQPEYVDFDYDGSALSTLLSVHALNSHYMAFYLNQVANESFLSTAVKRSSVVSLAKSIGYIPRSASAGSAKIQIEFFKDNPSDAFSNITLNAPVFFSTFLNTYYIFSTKDTIVIKESNGQYLSPEFTVTEGKRFTYSTVITSDIRTSGFTIPNINVDVNHVVVNVTENAVTTRYELMNNILDISSETKGFFFYENADGKLVIEFGDGVVGYSPVLGSLLSIEYLVCSGAAPNTIDAFNIANLPLSSTGSYVVRTVLPVSGGGDTEDINSIRKLAPLSFTAQNRAVIDKDYVILLKTKYPSVEDAVTFGGETLDPPKFGKVIIVVKLKNSLFLTSYDKTNIANFIKKYNMLTVTPIIMEPDYVYINVVSKVLYDPILLVGSTSQLHNKVLDGISTFENTYLNAFDRDFRYSTFLRLIDFADKSIVANTTKISLEKKLTPTLNTRTFIDVTFNNPVEEGTISSSPFTYGGKSGCFMDDTIPGVLTVYQYTSGIKNTIASNFGTINYDTGKLTIPAITIDSLDDINNINPQTNERFLSFYATPLNNDVIIDKTNIAKFNKIDLTLEI